VPCHPRTVCGAICGVAGERIVAFARPGKRCRLWLLPARKPSCGGVSVEVADCNGF
jgi:hypothetical protein